MIGVNEVVLENEKLGVEKIPKFQKGKYTTRRSDAHDGHTQCIWRGIDRLL